MPEHWVDDGEHDTHDPLRQTGVCPEQDAPAIQFPVPSHDRGTLPWQSELPGTHAVQSPAMQAVEQTWSSHVPEELQC